MSERHLLLLPNQFGLLSAPRSTRPANEIRDAPNSGYLSNRVTFGLGLQYLPR